MFLDRYSGTIIRMWTILAPFIAYMRDAVGDSELFQHFELLAVYAKSATTPTRIRAASRGWRYEIHGHSHRCPPRPTQPRFSRTNRAGCGEPAVEAAGLGCPSRTT